MTLGIESSSFQEKCIQASTFAFSRHIQTDNEVTYLAPSTKSEKEAKSRKFSSIESEKYDAIELGSNNDAINDDVSSDGKAIQIDKMTQTELKSKREQCIQINMKNVEYASCNTQTDPVSIGNDLSSNKGLRTTALSDYLSSAFESGFGNKFISEDSAIETFVKLDSVVTEIIELYHDNKAETNEDENEVSGGDSLLDIRSRFKFLLQQFKDSSLSLIDIILNLRSKIKKLK